MRRKSGLIRTHYPMIFGKTAISNTCATYKPEDYPDCYLNFIKDMIGQKHLHTPSVIHILAAGTTVSINAKKDADFGINATQKEKVKLRYALEIVDLTLGLIEKDQYWRSVRRIMPPGPEAEIMTRIDSNADDRYQLTACNRIAELLKITASVSCLTKGSCPALAERKRRLESRYLAVKEKSPKQVKEITETELKALIKKANISPKAAELILGSENAAGVAHQE